jgi:beta-carotene hydroxylase
MSAASEINQVGDGGQSRRRMREEAAIAQKYTRRVPWEMVAWGLTNFAVWLSIWPLTFAGILPLWAAFLISTLCCILAYLPSHDAQHQSIARKGSKLHWVNELVGHVSLIPIVLPYKLAWIEHREHHAHANDPKHDPDFGFNGKNVWRAVWNGMKSRQPAAQDATFRMVVGQSNMPNIPRAIGEGVLLNTTYYVILCGLAWSGFAIEAFFIWWLPRHIGLAYLTTCLGWAPHFPYEETGRYRDTRAWKSPIGTILSMGMEYHQIHHLFPTIPLFQTGPAYWEMRELLAKRGVRDDRPDALPSGSEGVAEAPAR